ncbi:hypothetical protein CEQ90_01840 [Lewinellaceae bacterium SD302]|nr:hypothetical protein CEQ90_01840 [Lewinellaceae bacterium SD302]
MKILLLTFLLVTCQGLSAQTVELIVPTGHTRPILKLAVSPGGGLLASSSIDETVKVYVTDSGRELHTFRPGAMARDLAFSPDGRYLAVAAFKTVYILDLKDFKTIRKIEGWNTSSVCFHPELNELYYLTQRRNSTGEDPQQVRKIAIPGGSEQTITTVNMGEKTGVAALDISPAGDALLVVLPGNLAYRVPLAGGEIKAVPGARRFTPNDQLFYLRKTPGTVTMSVEDLEGSQSWQLATGDASVTAFNLTKTMDFYDGKLYWSNVTDRIASGSYVTGQLSMFEMPPGLLDRAIATGPDARLYVATKSNQVYVYRLPSLTSPDVIGESVLPPFFFAGSEEGNRLSWGGPAVSSLLIDGRHVLQLRHPGQFSTAGSSISGNGSLLIGHSTRSDLFSYFTPGVHVQVKNYKSGKGNVRAVATNNSGSQLAVISSSGYMIMNTATDRSVSKGDILAGDAYYKEDAALSNDGAQLLLNVAKYTNNDSKQTRTYTRLVNPATASVIWEKQISLESPRFSQDGQRIVGETYQRFIALDASNGNELESYPMPAGRFPYQSKVNTSLDRVAYTHDDRAYVYELSEKKEYRLTVPNEANLNFNQVAFFGDDFLAVTGREGVVRIFDLRTRSYIAALVQYAEGNDWAIIGADGRFDATPGSMQKLYYRVGQELVALEQLFEGFYTPGLAGEIFGRMSGGGVPPPISIGNLVPPPTVEIGYSEGNQRGLIVDEDVPEKSVVSTRSGTANITLTGNAPGSQIAELRLYQNGKLLGDATRGLIVEDDPGPIGNTRSFQVRLLPGTNEFKAVALNRQRTESHPARLLVDYQKPAQPGTVGRNNNDPPSNTNDPANGEIVNTGDANVNLHLITIGINDYANASYNLNYARADANGVAAELQSATRQLVGGRTLKTIRDADAKRENILAGLSEIVAAAGPEDIFVFYYAGHGVVVGEQDRQFYLVPHDVVDIYGNAGNLSQRGISAREIQRASAIIPAQRQLFVLDACQSGGALENLTLRGAAEDKAIAQLARATGTHWLTASASDQFASEFDELGHGAFTYVLMRALRGQSDENNDGTVTVVELKRYLEREVPKMTLKHTGQAQYPASFGYGNDFGIARQR